jgi:hypothetical protein
MVMLLSVSMQKVLQSRTNPPTYTTSIQYISSTTPL